LPYYLVAGFSIGGATTDPAVAEATSDFLFTHLAGANLSNQTVLLAWEHEHYPPLITYLLQSYGGTFPDPGPLGRRPTMIPSGQVKLDAHSNLTVDNALCEGIDSTLLPTRLLNLIIRAQLQKAGLNPHQGSAVLRGNRGNVFSLFALIPVIAEAMEKTAKMLRAGESLWCRRAPQRRAA